MSCLRAVINTQIGFKSSLNQETLIKKTKRPPGGKNRGNSRLRHPSKPKLVRLALVFVPIDIENVIFIAAVHVPTPALKKPLKKRARAALKNFSEIVQIDGKKILIEANQILI